MNQRRGDGAGRLVRSPAVRAWEAAHRARAPGKAGSSAVQPSDPDGSPTPGTGGGSPSPADRPSPGGEVRERLGLLAGAVVVVAVGVVLILAFATVFGLYKGTWSGWFGAPERPAVAQVGDCRRLGPVSADGFGYWWKCQVTVRAADGRVVHTVVDRSIVTPSDRGRQVEFREACKGGGTARCSYGRPVARGWKVALGAMNVIELCFLAVCAFMALLMLVRAVIGRRGAERLYNWLPSGWKTSA